MRPCLYNVLWHAPSISCICSILALCFPHIGVTHTQQSQLTGLPSNQPRGIPKLERGAAFRLELPWLALRHGPLPTMIFATLRWQSRCVTSPLSRGPLLGTELDPLVCLTIRCRTRCRSRNLESLFLVEWFRFVSYLYELFIHLLSYCW